MTDKYHFLAADSLQSADKDQQESRAVAGKPNDSVAKFDTYRNLQLHLAVLPAGLFNHLSLPFCGK